MKLSWMILLMPCILVVKAELDPCTSYKELSDADRHKSFTRDTGKSDATDLEAGAWYRFTGEAGKTLSNRLERKVCYRMPSCGTTNPGYMIGRNPKKEGKVTSKTVCFIDGTDWCAKQVSIKVKRCQGEFLVYQLPAAPSGGYRYCGGKKKVRPTKAPPTAPPVPPTTAPPTPPPVPPTTSAGVKTGEDKDHPGTSCKDVKGKNTQGGSGLYWINPAGGSAFQAYCDQETAGGGWTLVYSYTFTNYPNFNDGSNEVKPRPSWTATGDTPVSTTTPLSETQWGAMDFTLWKHIGHEFLVKSNINNWISCTEGTGSLVEYTTGDVNCTLIKNVASVCHDRVPSHFRASSYGPFLMGQFKSFYFWDSSPSMFPYWPIHDPCGESLPNQVKDVPNPHGNIFIR